jgi:hypothetical protein
VRLDAPPVIDGDLSDPAWTSAARAESFSDAATSRRDIDQTEAWIGYDDTALYVAFRCRDAQPNAIVARQIRRDGPFSGDDLVSLQIDPFGLRKDYSVFTTNALGTPSSAISGGRARKLEWKGEWQSAAKRLPDGWAAEMRIPWQMLSFPTSSRPVNMGINFYREQERTKVQSYWSNLGLEHRPDLGGVWEGVQLPKGLFRRTLSLLPYLTTDYSLAGGRRTRLGLGRDRLLNLGLDARLALSPELTAIGAVNPDFSTVEGAVAGIDFIRGERLVPDTRPFFLEAAGLFNPTLSLGSGWGSAFFSGRVPAFDLGGKLYGRYGPRDTVGVLATSAFETQRHDFVGRWGHDMGADSTVGAYLVQRSLPGSSNTVMGINNETRRGATLIRADLAGSTGDGASGSALNAGVRHHVRHGEVTLGYTRVSPDFRAENGFVPFTDFHGPALNLYYEREWRSGWLREGWIGAGATHHWRTDGRFFRNTLGVNGGVETRGDWGFRGGWNGGRFLNERDSEFRVGVTRNVSNRYDRVGIDYAFGKRADHPIQFLQPFASRRFAGKWDVGISTSLLFHTERHSLHVITFGRELDSFRAVGGRVVIEDGALHYFLSYRHSGGRGTELFFLLGDPLAVGKRTHTRFMAKVVFPVTIR